MGAVGRPLYVHILIVPVKEVAPDVLEGVVDDLLSLGAELGRDDVASLLALEPQGVAGPLAARAQTKLFLRQLGTGLPAVPGLPPDRSGPLPGACLTALLATGTPRLPVTGYAVHGGTGAAVVLAAVPNLATIRVTITNSQYSIVVVIVEVIVVAMVRHQCVPCLVTA